MFIGIDGGGTKTAFIIVDDAGNIIAHHTEGTCSYLAIGIENSRRILENGIKILLQKSNFQLSDIKFTFIGLPSYGEDQKMERVLNDLPSSMFAAETYSCGSDAICGWAGSLACEDGINIIAGTGSMSYGEYKDKKVRVGGWGELFSDEGSAYKIACEGLNVFTKMSDGRLKHGPVYEMLKTHLSLETDMDLSGIILDTWDGDRGKIASLSKVMHAAAVAGDKQIIDIFNRSGEELANIVDTTKFRLGFPSSMIASLSYSGGVFNAGKFLLNPLKRALKSKYNIVNPRFSPVVGAALYAAKQYGFLHDEKALFILEKQEKKFLSC